MATAMASRMSTTPCNLQAISVASGTTKGLSSDGAVQRTHLSRKSIDMRLRACSSALSSGLRRRELFGATLLGVGISPKQQCGRGCGGSKDGATTCVLEEATAVSSAEELPETSGSESRIWMSDVVVKKRRNYFKNREWTAKDLTYGGFMAFMHGLCLFAPATFSWNAFGVFMGLYVITGMLGITLSFHRNLSHKSFKVPKWLEYAFAYCGIQAVQVIGDVISFWVIGKWMESVFVWYCFVAISSAKGDWLEGHCE
jgi:hypothetical protein